MITYCKNQNEYRIDGKLYIKSIKKCECRGIKGKSYNLWCKIHQRGQRSFLYNVGDLYLENGNNKFLMLGDDALKLINDTINDYDKKVSYMQTSGSCLCESEKGKLYYERKPFHSFNCLLIDTKTDPEEITYYENISVEFLAALSNYIVKVDLTSSEDAYMNHPFYKLSVKDNDEIMKLKFKLKFGIDTAEDDIRLYEITNKKVLPRLPEEYNKTYIVQSKTIPTNVLYDSGYCVMHRPYFAMVQHGKRCTHYKWQLNPHTRQGIDAAFEDDEAIDFCDYLRMFDEYLINIKKD